MNEGFLLIFFAYVWDFCVGDPKFLWHPVCSIGFLIKKTESTLRKIFPKTKSGELLAGTILLLSVCSIVVGIYVLFLFFTEKLWGSTGKFLFEGVFCGILLAARSLYTESMLVHQQLKKGDLLSARNAVSMIVGRDTENLDESAVTRATVETVAENFCDGVVAPLFFLWLGGSFSMLCFKVVSTLDSMVGYQNEKYRYFGTASAKCDDIFNFIPARIASFVMILTSPTLHLNGKRAFLIFCRDRKNHKSPNSAHTESVVAGALGIKLGGNGIYSGKLVEKPSIGDKIREIQANDIQKTNDLMLLSTLFFVLLLGILTV